DALHQLLAQPALAIRCVDEDIAQPGEGGVVRDHARKAHLSVTVVHAEAERVGDGFLDNGPAAPDRPVTLFAEIAMNVGDVKTAAVSADFDHAGGHNVLIKAPLGAR